MRGRKSKLTPEVSQRIVELVRAGNYLESAASGCGIHRSTLHRWLERGEQQTHGMYREFYLAVDRAQGEGELRDMLQIAKAAQTDWRAAAWRLERRAPRRYGTQVQATLRDEMESMLAHLETVLDQSTFEKVLQAFDQRNASGIGHGLPAKDSSTIEDTRRKLLERLNHQVATPEAANDEGHSRTDHRDTETTSGRRRRGTQ